MGPRLARFPSLAQKDFPLPLTHEQEISLLHGGTVRFPSPAPATGALAIIVGGADPTKPSHPSDLYLKITHQISPKLTIARVIRLRDVQVVFAKVPGQNPTDPPKEVYLTIQEIARNAFDYAMANPPQAGQPIPWQDSAAVLVSESAPVLMIVETGTTAAESADYRPQLGTSRSVKGRQLKGFFIDANQFHEDDCHP